MIDLTKLSPEQATKIEVVLMLMENDFKAFIQMNENLSQDFDLPEEGRRIFEANTTWHKEAYRLIYGKEYSR